MKEEKLVAWRTVLLLIAVVVLIAGCSQPQQKGTLYGKVTIGPLCPVEPCNVPPEQVTQAYFARRLLVYDEGKTRVIQEIRLGNDESYSAKLNPGAYVVDINRLGIDRSAEVPKEITIESGKSVELNVDIDTGIR